MDRYISRKEIRDALGISLSSVDNYLRAAEKAGFVHPARPGGKGGRVLVLRAEFEAYLEWKKAPGQIPPTTGEAIAGSPAA